jgi:hypothetical protein
LIKLFKGASGKDFLKGRGAKMKTRVLAQNVDEPVEELRV